MDMLIQHKGDNRFYSLYLVSGDFSVLLLGQLGIQLLPAGSWPPVHLTLLEECWTLAQNSDLGLQMNGRGT